MRQKLSRSFLASFISHASTAQPPETMNPVGAHTFTPMTENNPGEDVGTVSCRLFFDGSSNLTFADVVFNDFTVGKIFTFTNPGPIFIMTSPEIVGATVFNAIDPNQYFQITVGFPSGIFTFPVAAYPCLVTPPYESIMAGQVLLLSA